jgi:hypothetical protein
MAPVARLRGVVSGPLLWLLVTRCYRCSWPDGSATSPHSVGATVATRVRGSSRRTHRLLSGQTIDEALNECRVPFRRPESASVDERQVSHVLVAIIDGCLLLNAGDCC